MRPVLTALTWLSFFAAGTTRDFVTQRWVEILEPFNGAAVSPEDGVIRCRVGEARLPVRIEGDKGYLETYIDSHPRELVVDLGGGTNVGRFCVETGLSRENCEVLESAARQLEEQARAWAGGYEYAREICVSLHSKMGQEDRWCAPEATWKLGMALPAHLIAPGQWYRLEANETGFPGTGAAKNGPLTARSTVHFVGRVDARCRAPPKIVRPAQGAVVDADNVLVEVETTATICVSIDEGLCSTTRKSFAVSAGRHQISVVELANPELDKANDGCFGGRKSVVEFEARRGWDARKRLAAAVPPPRLITAVSERYVTQEIIHNLVGSLKFWQPDAVLCIYDLGLSDESKKLLSSWTNVRLVSINEAMERIVGDTSPYPSHILDPGTYAFKAVVIAHALREAGTVLWIDANVEVRRPLDEISLIIAETGHFLVEHPYRFPTSQFHHPSALEQLGCSGVADFSRAHCATTFVGATTRGWFASEVLPRLVNCSIVATCINPVGSSRANNRQEQTALNAILCNLGAPPDGVCTDEKRFRLTSDFENDHDPMQPTADETDWNHQLLYTRRNHPVKPYVRFVAKS